MAGTMMKCWRTIPLSFVVSMESGLDGRNNVVAQRRRPTDLLVSMESGLDGRNNPCSPRVFWLTLIGCLNGVRPRWPEQYSINKLQGGARD